jgi:hypothetical protein
MAVSAVPASSAISFVVVRANPCRANSRAAASSTEARTSAVVRRCRPKGLVPLVADHPPGGPEAAAAGPRLRRGALTAIAGY